ncbi:uncharacterized protein [Heliangelus exortis]|uniref:uncharacterized protein n=1 Tax=Heliangelus exortis TaxID=472823 RepID=UPI003A8CF800
MGTRGMVTAWLCIVLLQAGDAWPTGKDGDPTEPGTSPTLQVLNRRLEPPAGAARGAFGGHLRPQRSGPHSYPGFIATVFKEAKRTPKATAPTHTVTKFMRGTTTATKNKLQTTPKATSTPPQPWDPMKTRERAWGKGTYTSLDVHFRYWAPALFVAIALLVLLINYRWTKGEETEDEATSASDTSDLGAPSHIPAQAPTLRILAPEPHSSPDDADSCSSDDLECYHTPPGSRKPSWWWNSPGAKQG